MSEIDDDTWVRIMRKELTLCESCTVIFVYEENKTVCENCSPPKIISWKQYMEKRNADLLKQAKKKKDIDYVNK